MESWLKVHEEWKVYKKKWYDKNMFDEEDRDDEKYKVNMNDIVRINYDENNDEIIEYNNGNEWVDLLGCNCNDNKDLILEIYKSLLNPKVK